MKATADCWKETKSPGKIDAEIHLAPPQHKINKSMGILPPQKSAGKIDAENNERNNKPLPETINIMINFGGAIWF